MKKIIIFLSILFALVVNDNAWSQVSINTSGSSPDASAMLEIESSTKGLLIPRMTATERDNISTPATGLLVFVTNDNHYYYYDGSSWIDLVLANDTDWTVSGSDMYSTLSGKVGIGTTTPTGSLHVASGLENSGYFTSTSSSVNTSVLYSEYTGSSTIDAIAIYGSSIPADYNGYGGYFEGGWIGVYGEVLPSGADEYYGFYGYVDGGTGTNYGLYGQALSSTGTNYSVYGIGHYLGTSYAGYFEGDVNVTGTLTSPVDNLLKKNIRSFDGALERINGLEVHAFEYANDRLSGKIQLPAGSRIGFSSESLEAQLPGLLSEVKHSVRKEDKSERGEEVLEFEGVNLLDMIPVLTRAIQEQQEIIEKMENRIRELENKDPER